MRCGADAPIEPLADVTTHSLYGSLQPGLWWGGSAWGGLGRGGY